MNLFAAGEARKVHVDDALPTNTRGRLLMSKSSANNAWWVPILEKAYAKFHVNYSNLAGGTMAEALHTLTNMPVRGFHVKKMTDDQIWNAIRIGDENGWVMTGGCKGGYKGLVGGHAYTVIGIQELTNEAGTKVEHRLVKVRNPWGVEKYTGDFSDSDKKWTAEYKKQAGLVEKNDGTFFIPIEKFKEAFPMF